MLYDSDKYHRRSIRLKGYDYSQTGYYFLTICARNRECIFAEFYPGVGAGLAPAQISAPNSFPIFRLSNVGKIIEKNWLDIAIKYNHVTIDNFVIMPNHIHGILIVGRKFGAPARAAQIIRRPLADMICLPPKGGAPTLGQIIGSFKSKCVIDYMKYCLEKSDEEIWKIWQRNYYEHIIRDEKELNQIRQYILENPAKWLEDEDNPINIENNQRIGHPRGVPLQKIKTSY